MGSAEKKFLKKVSEIYQPNGPYPKAIPNTFGKNDPAYLEGRKLKSILLPSEFTLDAINQWLKAMREHIGGEQAFLPRGLKDSQESNWKKERIRHLERNLALDADILGGLAELIKTLLSTVVIEDTVFSESEKKTKEKKRFTENEEGRRAELEKAWVAFPRGTDSQERYRVIQKERPDLLRSEDGKLIGDGEALALAIEAIKKYQRKYRKRNSE